MTEQGLTLLLTPGTIASAVAHAGTGVCMERGTADALPSDDNAAIMRNARGFFAVGPTLWTGYYSSERMAVLAVAMLRAVMLSVERDDSPKPNPAGPPHPFLRVEVP